MHRAMAACPMQLAERSGCGRRAHNGVWTSLLVTSHVDTPRAPAGPQYAQSGEHQSVFRGQYVHLTEHFLTVLGRCLWWYDTDLGPAFHVLFLGGSLPVGVDADASRIAADDHPEKIT